MNACKPNANNMLKNHKAHYILMKNLWKMLKMEARHLTAYCRKHIELTLAWIRLKDANDISRRHFELGQKELDNAKSKARKEIDNKMLDEFDKSARDRARAVKASPRNSFKARLFIMKRIKHNLLQLLHPIRMLRNTRKTKKMAYTDGWKEVNGK